MGGIENHFICKPWITRIMGHPYVVMDEYPGKLHPLTGDERRFWGEKSQGVNAAPYSTSWVWTRKKK